MFVLIIDDDNEINQLLQRAFTQAGHTVQASLNGLDGLRRASENTFDLIILDIMLPFKSGEEVLLGIRAVIQTPVMMLSAQAMTRTKVNMLGLGADDYVTKPFDTDELLARAEAVVRRYNAGRQPYSYKTIEARGLFMDTEMMTVTLNGQNIRLTAKEYQILERLLAYPQKVFSKRNLFESVWGEAYQGADSTLTVHINNLRGKLKEACPNEEFIETVWGIGYRLYVKK